MHIEEIAATVDLRDKKQREIRELDARDAHLREFEMDEEKRCFLRGWELGARFAKEYASPASLSSAWRVRESGGPPGAFPALRDDVRRFWDYADVPSDVPSPFAADYEQWGHTDHTISELTKRQASAAMYGVLLRTAFIRDELRLLASETR
jgi:hypothetical protein